MKVVTSVETAGEETVSLYAVNALCNHCMKQINSSGWLALVLSDRNS